MGDISLVVLCVKSNLRKEEILKREKKNDIKIQRERKAKKERFRKKEGKKDWLIDCKGAKLMIEERKIERKKERKQKINANYRGER